MTRTYVPIDCEFHDVLEAVATLRRVVAIDHLDDEGNRRVVDARIADLFARDGAEYMRLDDGSLIRLDKLVSIDDAQRSIRTRPSLTGASHAHCRPLTIAREQASRNAS